MAAGFQVLMMQEVMSQHSRADWSTDVKALGRLPPTVFSRGALGAEAEKNIKKHRHHGI